MLPRIDYSNIKFTKREVLKGNNGILRHCTLGTNSLQVESLVKSPRAKMDDRDSSLFSKHLDNLAYLLLSNKIPDPRSTLIPTSYIQSRLALPTAIIIRDDSYYGYAMRLFKKGCEFNHVMTGSESRSSLFSLQFLLLSREDRQRQGIPVLSRETRLALARDLIKVVAAVHQRNIVIGDLSYKNWVIQKKVSRDSKVQWRTLLLDVDSFKENFLPSPWDQGTSTGMDLPEWSAASARLKLLDRGSAEFEKCRASRDTQTQMSDVYKAGLLLLPLLLDDWDQAASRDLIADRRLEIERRLEMVEACYKSDFVQSIQGMFSEEPRDRPSSISLHTCTIS